MRLVVFFIGVGVLFTGFFARSEVSDKSDQAVGVFYFSPMYGHIYQFPNIDSVSLTTLSCGHPLRVYPMKDHQSKKGLEWRRVKTVGLEGYVEAKYLLDKREQCFQDRYTKFFNALNFSVTEMYYLGRLSSLYIDGHSKVSRP